MIILRTDDRSLSESEPGKPYWLISPEKSAGRIQHVDVKSVRILFGCSSGWGQRRDVFLRTPTARKALGFDLAAFEVDSRLATEQASVPMYPRNEALVFNLRTYERWNLLEGTRVLALHGNTALLERNDEIVLVRLKPDATLDRLSQPIKRPPFAAILSHGAWVAVGPLLFELQQGKHIGSFPLINGLPRAPLALSTSGSGLFPARPASPTRVSEGPFRWVTAD